MQALAGIVDILRHAKVYHHEPSYKSAQHIAKTQFYYLRAPFMLGNEPYTARVVIRQDNNGHRYYDLQTDGAGAFDSAHKKAPRRYNLRKGWRSWERDYDNPSHAPCQGFDSIATPINLVIVDRYGRAIG